MNETEKDMVGSKFIAALKKSMEVEEGESDRMRWKAALFWKQELRGQWSCFPQVLG